MSKLAPPLLNNGNIVTEEAPSLRPSSSSCENPVQDALLSLPNNVNSNNNNKKLLHHNNNNNNNNTRIIVSRVNLNEKQPKKTEHKVAEGFLEEMETLTKDMKADDTDDEDRPFDFVVKLRNTSSCTDCPWIGHYDDLAYIVRQEKGNSSNTILGVFSGVATFSKFEHGCLYQLLDLDHSDRDDFVPKTVVKVNNPTKRSFHLDKLGIKVVPVDNHPYWNGFPKRYNLPVGSDSGGCEGYHHDFKYHRAVNAFIANAPADGEMSCADYVVDCLYVRESIYTSSI